MTKNLGYFSTLDELIMRRTSFEKHKFALNQIRNRKTPSMQSITKSTSPTKGTVFPSIPSKSIYGKIFIKEENDFYYSRLSHAKSVINIQKEISDYQISRNYMKICRRFSNEKLQSAEKYLRKIRFFPSSLKKKSPTNTSSQLL